MMYIMIISIMAILIVFVALLLILCKVYEALTVQKRIVANYEETIDELKGEIQLLKNIIKNGEYE